MSVDQERTAVAFANRAMALLKLGEHERAEEDATSALEIDPSYLKALQRRSTARREQGKLLEAMEDCESALRLTPQSQALRGDRRALAKAYRDAEGLEPLKTEATVTIAKDARAAQKTKERGEEVEPEEDAGPPAAARSEARPAAAVAAASPPSRPLPVPKARASPSAPHQGAQDVRRVRSRVEKPESGRWGQVGPALVTGPARHLRAAQGLAHRRGLLLDLDLHSWQHERRERVGRRCGHPPQPVADASVQDQRAVDPLEEEGRAQEPVGGEAGRDGRGRRRCGGPSRPGRGLRRHKVRTEGCK